MDYKPVYIYIWITNQFTEGLHDCLHKDYMVVYTMFTVIYTSCFTLAFTISFYIAAFYTSCAFYITRGQFTFVDLRNLQFTLMSSSYMRFTWLVQQFTSLVHAPYIGLQC